MASTIPFFITPGAAWCEYGGFVRARAYSMRDGMRRLAGISGCVDARANHAIEFAERCAISRVCAAASLKIFSN